MGQRAFAYYRLPRSARSAAERALRPQAQAVAELARARGLVVLEPFVETPGRGGARPELARALARCREDRAVLLVAALAEVGRDAAFLEAVLRSGVRLLAADAPRSGRRTLALLHAVAAHERAAASERSRQALRDARARGVRLGSPRPELGSRRGVAAIRARADACALAVAPAIEELRLSNPGASLRALAEGLDALGAETPRGGRWGPSSVRNAIRRAGLPPAPLTSA